MPAGPVLLSGYSHGSVIASAVIAQLPRDVRGDVALLTLACPLRRLYGRAFPAYFGGDQLAALAEMLDAGGRAGADGRWKNLCRRSDYLGSWVFHDPEPRSDAAYLAGHVDQPAPARDGPARQAGPGLILHKGRARPCTRTRPRRDIARGRGYPAGGGSAGGRRGE